jgi:hypothetical protein
LQYLRLCCLWIAKVHHLVQQFVDDDKVVAYTLLFQLLEVLCEDLDNFVEEEQYFGGIGIAFCYGEEVEVIVADVEVLRVHC